MYTYLPYRNTFYTLYQKRMNVILLLYLDVCGPIRNERKQLFLYFILLASATTLTLRHVHSPFSWAPA